MPRAEFEPKVPVFKDDTKLSININKGKYLQHRSLNFQSVTSNQEQLLHYLQDRVTTSARLAALTAMFLLQIEFPSRSSQI
jgi:hypothetical protein